MSKEMTTNDNMLAGTANGRETVEAELQKTKQVAVFSGKGSISEIPADAAQGSAQLESELVDGAISRMSSNLPAEVLRVSQLQRHQGSHISAMQAQFSDLREQKKKEILDLVRDGQIKRRIMSTKIAELRDLKKRLDGYRVTLDDQGAFVSSCVVVNSHVQDGISALQDNLDKLEEKRNSLKNNPEAVGRIRDGSAERKLRDRVAYLATESVRLQKEIHKFQEKVQSIRLEHEQLKQATAVLQKRNAAQMLKLRRQVKTQHLRYRQWSDQSRQLKQNVDTLSEKMDTE